MLVAGEGRAPGRAHLLQLAKEAGVKRAARIVDEVHAAVSDFESFAHEAGVPAKLRSRVSRAISRA